MELIPKLKARLANPLPGWEAQWKMASYKLVEPVNKETLKHYAKPEGHKTAGVLALIYFKDNQWFTALMQRTPSTFAHGRQVSFPGGGIEKSDADVSVTALRETQEEFGVPAQNIQLLGRLTELYIPVSNYLVHPFVGYIDHIPSFVPDPNEVAEVLEIPLQHLLDNNRRKIKDMMLPEGIKLKDVPYFDLHDRVVWGATAMMLSELSAVLEEVWR